MIRDGTQVLVTGGAGFIGSHVTRDLLDRGAAVDVVDNLFAGERRLVPDDAVLHEVDIRDPDDLADTVAAVDPDVVVHLAAIHYIPYCNEHPEEAFDVNVMGTRHLLEAARDLDGLDRIVYSSSAAVYPPRDEPHAETDPTGPMDIYGRTKLVGEDLLELFAPQTEVPCASARLFNVYGPNETNDHLVPAILDQLHDGSRSVELGNLTPARDLVHVTDVSRALVSLAADLDPDHRYRAYNVGTGTEHTVREVVERVSEALGDEIEIEQDQERVRESDRPHLRPSIDRIEREIGWQPQVAVVDGCRDLLATEGITR